MGPPNAPGRPVLLHHLGDRHRNAGLRPSRGKADRGPGHWCRRHTEGADHGDDGGAGVFPGGLVVCRLKQRTACKGPMALCACSSARTRPCPCAPSIPPPLHAAVPAVEQPPSAARDGASQPSLLFFCAKHKSKNCTVHQEVNPSYKSIPSSNPGPEARRGRAARPAGSPSPFPICTFMFARGSACTEHVPRVCVESAPNSRRTAVLEGEKNDRGS